MASSLTPATRTYDAFVAEVANYVKIPAGAGDKGESLAQAKVLNAINWFNQRHWGFMLTKEDVTLVAETDTYALTATGMKKPRSCTALASADRPTARRIHFIQPDAMADNKDTFYLGPGWPRYYTFFNYSEDLTLDLDRKPSTGFVTVYPKLRVRFYHTLEVPATGTTKFDMPSYAEPALLWRAKYEIALDFDMKKADRADQQAQQAWAQLIDNDDEFTDGLEGVDGLTNARNDHWG